MGITRLKPLVRAAIQNGNSPLVAEYLARGGDINAPDQRGRTPLMLAASRGHMELCRMLLECGADSSLRDNEGYTALEIAQHEGGRNVVHLIESHLPSPAQGSIPDDPDDSASGLLDAWMPEIEVVAPIEDIAIRVHVLASQDGMQAGRPVDRDADWGDLEIDLPEPDGLEIERAFQREDLQELLAALIGEARLRGAYRPSLAAAVAIELDGEVDGDVFQNISQVLGDIGCIPEEDEEEWGNGCPLSEEWRGDDTTEDCLRYLRDLQSLTNDPYVHLKKEVKLSVLLDREGEERIGRLISLAIKDACDAIASEDRVLAVLVDLDRLVQEEPYLAGRISRLLEGTEEDTDAPLEEEEEVTCPTGITSQFRTRLAEAILAYRQVTQTGHRNAAPEAIEKLELTVLGIRVIQKGLAVAGVLNKQLNGAIERATRLKFEMFFANVRLAVSVAEKYGWSKIPRMDRIQEAYIGLLKAIDKFDFGRGIKFSTYATWWLRQSVTRAIADKERAIRIPVHVLEKVSKLASAARASGSDTALSMPISQLSSMTSLSEAEIVKALRIVEDPALWEDSPDAFAASMSLADDDESPLAFAERLEMERIVRECVDRLPTREAEVIKHRFGLLDTGEKTLEEVGRLYDLTRERIRQIESKALLKLQNRGNRIVILEDYAPESG